MRRVQQRAQRAGLEKTERKEKARREGGNHQEGDRRAFRACPGGDVSQRRTLKSDKEAISSSSSLVAHDAEIRCCWEGLSKSMGGLEGLEKTNAYNDPSNTKSQPSRPWKLFEKGRALSGDTRQRIG